jgi:RimJ/RimL family protein N-acetyltransferase
MASRREAEQNRAMDPVTLTTERLLLRTVGAQDADAVYAAAQDPDIQRWTTIPSPYLREHAEGFVGQLAPDGWADASMFTFGVFLPAGTLVGMLGLTMRSLGVAEVGFWTAKEHRGNGYITEATLGASRWAFIRFTIEGVLRSAINNKGVRRDCWVGSLLPSDLGLPSTAPYLPAPSRTP